MKKTLFLVLILILIFITNNQLSYAETNNFKVALLEFLNNHYLFDNYKHDETNLSLSKIYLNTKVWNNPNDTKKLVDSVKMLAEKMAPHDYQISVYGEPYLLQKIALITINPNGVDLKYTYNKVKPSWKNVEVLKIRGREIFKGLHADSVFEVLTKKDTRAESDVKKDSNGRLIVTHHWELSSQMIDITFKHWDNMYRVHEIRTLTKSGNKNQQNKTKIEKKGSNRPKSCHIYNDCEAYGGCKNYSNCYGACLEECMQIKCTQCK